MNSSKKQTNKNPKNTPSSPEIPPESLNESFANGKVDSPQVC